MSSPPYVSATHPVAHGGIFINKGQGQVEMGSKNHEVVPTSLIAQISGLRGASGVNKSISAIAKVGLIAKVKNAKCLFRRAAPES